MEIHSNPIQRAIASQVGLQVALLKRVSKPLGLLLFVFVAGTFGFWILGWSHGKAWSVIDCAYMTSITLTTVGFGDVLGVSATVEGKVYTMFLIVSGMGATIYSVSQLTAFIVEGYVGEIFQETRLKRMRQSLKDHTIICGAGQTGTHVIEEHAATGHPFCVIDKSDEKIAHVLEENPQVIYVQGDATDEEVLEKAGVRRSSGLVAALSSDKDNLFLVVTARYMCSDLNIITKCIDHDSVGKFKAAGANQVISPTYIGGMRMASQMIRPHVVDFLDNMLRSSGSARVSETIVEEGSELAGQTIAESRLMERVGLLVVAMKRRGNDEFIYSPPAGTVLEAGVVLVVIGPVAKVQTLEDMGKRIS
ncbi:MAG: potassium channel protein [Deltaproteobacteria bacterium]|nr:potassium channel protein [Deltaproteobacteria bacterium]